MNPPDNALTIALHPDGWKLHLLHEGSPKGPLRLTVAATEQIARALGDAVIAEGPEVHPFELVRSATLNHKDKLDKQLAEAEATAKSIPGLRKAREEVENIQ